MPNTKNNQSNKRNQFLLLNIFARIWALWGLVSFIITFLVILIPALLTAIFPDPKGMHYFIKVAKAWMLVWLKLVGCSVKVTGKAHFSQNETFIVTCNHNSLLDVPLSSPFIPGGNKTIAKKSFTKVPLFGWFYKRGAVIVDRKSDASRRKSFELMKAALDKGLHMCIYPEGTRNRTDMPLKKFYDGAFKLSVDTKHAIIPAIILNTKKALPLHKFFYFLPQQLSINFLAPIYPEDMNAETLKNKVHQIMSNYYTEVEGK